MSLATAGEEIPRLAEDAGFTVQSRRRNSLALFHRERNEGITLCTDETGRFDHAYWHAPTEFVTVVDRRAPGERGKRDGLALTANGKRRAVGMSEVRAEARTRIEGMDIGYTELKKRIKNAEWRKS